MSEKSLLNQSQKKQFRTIGHKLEPVVTIGEAGLTENVEKEINRALEDHELIKIKLPGGDREFKQAAIEEICKNQLCALVQKIGNVALLYRAAAKPNPKLSNILRHNH